MAKTAALASQASKLSAPFTVDGMDKMKKAEVIQHAEAALQGSGWLPSPLR